MHMQYPLNLIRNAKYACEDSLSFDERLTTRATTQHGLVKIVEIDGFRVKPMNGKS